MSHSGSARGGAPQRSVVEPPSARSAPSRLRELLALSLLLSDGRPAAGILDLVRGAVRSWTSCEVVAVPREPGDADAAGVRELRAEGGRVGVDGRGWAWAYPMRAFTGPQGHLVVAGDRPPSADERFLLTSLAHYAGVALGQDALRHRLRAVAGDLDHAEAELRQHTAIQETLARAAADPTEDRIRAIAEALHAITGLPVIIEDSFGHARAWSGLAEAPVAPAAAPAPGAPELRGPLPVRDGDRLVTAAQPRHEVLGTIALVDPGRMAGERDEFALTHAALVLSGELAHVRAVAEVERRQRRELVDELLDGADDATVTARARALGYDLDVPHRAVVAGYPAQPADEPLASAVERAVAALGGPGLVARRGDHVVLLIPDPPPGAASGTWERLHAAVRERLGGPGAAEVAVGVGRPADGPGGLAQSWRDAQRAHAVRAGGNERDGVTVDDELGLDRILGTGAGSGDLERYVDEWLGALLRYDAESGSELTRTLRTYLDRGGSYDETAAALIIHRSTLRYRLQRIRDLTGLDLGDPETRLNLHVAVRGWSVLGGDEDG